MKKRSVMFLLAGTLLATMIPSVAAAHVGGPRQNPDVVPGCRAGWAPSAYPGAGPVPAIRNIGFRRADRNRDGWACSKIVSSRRNPDNKLALWRDNRNYRDPLF